MPEAVIAAAVRTPIGRARKGSLADERPDDLLAFAIREAVAQVPGLDPAEIVDVMAGCGFPQEKQGMNLARRAALLAGLPDAVAGTTVNRFCASSLQTTRMAFHAIRAGEGGVYVSAGVESARGPSSAATTPPSAFVYGVSSRAKKPDAWAATARSCERCANRSISSRETSHCSATFSAVNPIGMYTLPNSAPSPIWPGWSSSVDFG